MVDPAPWHNRATVPIARAPMHMRMTVHLSLLRCTIAHVSTHDHAPSMHPAMQMQLLKSFSHLNWSYVLLGSTLKRQFLGFIYETS